jgi:histidine triad (HIT) family protein
MNCIFCQIASRRKQEEILYEDDLVVAFLDRFRQPSVGGHILVIPREHVENIWSLPEELCGPLMRVARIASKAVRDTVPCTGVRLWIANGRSAGQEIMHLHVHVFPCRSAWDRITCHFPSLAGKHRLTDQELSEMANPIRARIQELVKA